MSLNWGSKEKDMEREVKNEGVARSAEKKRLVLGARDLDKESENKLKEVEHIQLEQDRLRNAAGEVCTSWESSVSHFKEHIAETEIRIQALQNNDDQSAAVDPIGILEAWLLKLRLCLALEEKQWLIEWSEIMGGVEMKNLHILKLMCDSELLDLESEHFLALKDHFVAVSRQEDYFSVHVRLSNSRKGAGAVQNMKRACQDRWEQLKSTYEEARDALAFNITGRLLACEEDYQQSSAKRASQLFDINELIRTLQEQHLTMFGIKINTFEV
jgi:hypothetical protein